MERSAARRGTKRPHSPVAERVHAHIDNDVKQEQIIKRRTGPTWHDIGASSAGSTSGNALHSAIPRCILQAAAEALHPGRVPATLPCRESQSALLMAFLRSCIENGRTGAMHVCGSPGVGKTATLTSVLGGLGHWAKTEGHTMVGDLTHGQGRVLADAHACAGSSLDRSASSTLRRSFAVHFVNGMTLDTDPGSLFKSLSARMQAAERQAQVDGAGQGQGCGVETLRAAGKASKGRGKNLVSAFSLPSSFSPPPLDPMASVDDLLLARARTQASSVEAPSKCSLPGGNCWLPSSAASFVEAGDSNSGDSGRTTVTTVTDSSATVSVKSFPKTSYKTPPVSPARPDSGACGPLPKVVLVAPRAPLRPRAGFPPLTPSPARLAAVAVAARACAIATAPVDSPDQVQGKVGKSKGKGSAGTTGAVARLERQTLEALKFTTFFLKPSAAKRAVGGGVAGVGVKASLSNAGNLGGSTVTDAATSSSSDSSMLGPGSTPASASAVVSRVDFMACIGLSNAAYEQAGHGVRVGEAAQGQAQALLHVLVVDETDVLMGSRAGGGNVPTPGQGRSALDRLFAWPHVPGSNVVLISIANAVDMTERHLPRLRSLGIAPHVVVFEPYGDKQLSAIVSERLARSSVHWDAPSLVPAQPLIDPLALLRLCKRVADHDGDVRKVLYMARRALLACTRIWCTQPSVHADGEGEVEEEDGIQLGGPGTSAISSTSRKDDMALHAVLRDIVGADAPAPDADGDADVDMQGPGEKERDLKEEEVEEAMDEGTAFAPCSCCSDGLAWRRVGAAPEIPGPAKPSSPKPSYAVTVPDMASLLKAAYEDSYVRSLLTLPRQAQVLICAARGVAEREALRKAKDEAFRRSRSAPDVPIAWVTVDGSHPDSEKAVKKARAQGAALSPAAMAAAAALEATGLSVPVQAVCSAYKRLCERHELASADESSQCVDLLERMAEAGLLTIQGGAGKGKGGGGSAGGVGAGRMRGAGTGRVSGRGTSMLTSSLRINVSLADIDLAFGDKAFYKLLAAKVRVGAV